MSLESTSAGQPGAPSCSNGQQAETQPRHLVQLNAARDLFASIASDLLSVRDELRALIGDGEGGARVSAALALVTRAGELADDAQGLMGGAAIGNWRDHSERMLEVLLHGREVSQ